MFFLKKPSLVMGSFSIRMVRSVENGKVLALEEPEQLLYQEQEQFLYQEQEQNIQGVFIVNLGGDR